MVSATGVARTKIRPQQSNAVRALSHITADMVDGLETAAVFAGKHAPSICALISETSPDLKFESCVEATIAPDSVLVSLAPVCAGRQTPRGSRPTVAMRLTLGTVAPCIGQDAAIHIPWSSL